MSFLWTRKRDNHTLNLGMPAPSTVLPIVLYARAPWPGHDLVVHELLQFSYVPGVNLAMEGSWAHGDPPECHLSLMDSDDHLLTTDEENSGPMDAVSPE